MIKKEMRLENLDCANCSAKIEKDLNHILQGRASINLVSQTLTLHLTQAEDASQLFDTVEKIVHQYEPDVKVIDASILKQPIEEDPQRLAKLKIMLTFVFMLLGYLFRTNVTVSFVFYLIAYGIVGFPIIHRAFNQMVKGQWLSEHFLMTIATLGAFILQDYPEAVGVMLFYVVGEFFQDKALNQSRKSIEALLNIKPEFAHLLKDGKIVTLEPEQICIDELIQIRVGEKIPLDGTVIEGTSTIDASMITGEALPKLLKHGDEAISGCINLSGVVTLKVTKTYANSTVAKILELVENASHKKAKTERFISRFAEIYTPIVVFLAIALALIPPLLFNEAFEVWTYRALIFLVISCPCALMISIPLGFFGGIGAASRKGILIKGGSHLESLVKVKAIVFDKTGTLTQGKFKVSEILSSKHTTKEVVLKTAALLESYSNHPLAKAIVEANPEPLNHELVKNFSEVIGYGLTGEFHHHRLHVGSSEYFTHLGIELLESKAGQVIHVAIDHIWMGMIVLEDELKHSSKEAILQLKQLGIHQIGMLSGDDELTAQAMGQSLGLDFVRGGLKPEDKVNEIEKLEKVMPHFMFVGDGVNDAPVIARSYVGVAMGRHGSDAAIQAADVVLMSDDPLQLVSAIHIAKMTQRIIFQNIGLALGIKLIFLTLGAFGLSTMWEAVFADTGVALLAVFNAMRIAHLKS